jgi:type III pantothenate kinase
MNLIIDIGNTRTKFAVFDGAKEVHSEAHNENKIEWVTQLVAKFPALEYCIISATGELTDDFVHHCKSVFKKVLVFNTSISVPFTIEYKTPETLGLDRLAGIAGAQVFFQNKNVLIISLGTAITFDIKTSTNIYKGGNISPGMKMRFMALNRFTHKLPLVEPAEEPTLIGASTNQAILNGVINGIIFEIEGMITETDKIYKDLTIILTGGDTPFFDNKLKKTIFVVPNLVSIGLNTILHYNAANI